MVFSDIEEPRMPFQYILKLACHVTSTMICKAPAAKASILVNMVSVKAGIVKNFPFLSYIHHVLVLGDHEEAW